MIKLLIIVFIIISLSFIGIAIKILLKKNGSMAGTCASQSPYLNKDGEDCSFCGKSPDKCKRRNKR